MGKINLSVDSNVTIRCFNKQKLTRTINCHNKATVGLVQGLLRFLKGDFTPSSYSMSAIHDTDAAVQYIPSEIKFGNVGVQIDTSTDPRTLSGIDPHEFKPPTFNEKGLQRPLESPYLVNKTRFEAADITSFDDTNNSMSLLLQTFVPAKSLVGYNLEGGVFQPYDWAYWNPSLGKIIQDVPTGEWETMITELGLYANNTLLARVVLDGEINIDSETGKITYVNPDYPNNPVFQSESSSMIIEWRIGIISIGPNDTFITEADINEEEGE